MAITIGSKTIKDRSTPAGRNPQRWNSVGVSMAGDVNSLDMGIREHTATIYIRRMAADDAGGVTGVENLETYLMDTIKPGGTVSCTPASNDDWGIGLSGATNLIFMSMNSEYVDSDKYNVTLVFKRYQVA